MFGPVDGQVLDAEAFVEVGQTFGDCIDDVGDLIADDELNILGVEGTTLAASWSPMNSPSLILTGPSMN